MVRRSQVVKHWPIERTQGLRTAEKGGSCHSHGVLLRPKNAASEHGLKLPDGLWGGELGEFVVAFGEIGLPLSSPRDWFMSAQPPNPPTPRFSGRHHRRSLRLIFIR